MSAAPGHPIAAVATGSGAAAVAIIRLSGAGCREIVLACLRRAPITPIPPRHDRRLHLEVLQDPHSLEVLDEAMVVLFTAPRSYTGEDSAEIHCHGGPYVIRRILDVLYRLGARPAEPGEFTRRAFLHGKLDLTAAEGIKALVEAQSHQQWVAARHLSTGRLRDVIETLRETLLEALAYLAAQIDFPDEGDTAQVTMEPVRRKVSEAQQQVQHLVGSYDNGRVASEGLMVALFGEPNAGKSTLMNNLLGRERAIVTAIPGTTRDYLEERCLLAGRLMRLVDMAGVHEAPDPVEAIGVASARRLASEADLVLFMTPASAPDPSHLIATWTRELAPRATLQIMTKSDLPPPAWYSPQSWLAISCHSGTGLEDLREALVAKVDAHVATLAGEQAFVTSARQVAALRAAADALTQFQAADASGAFEELLAFDLQQATRALKSIVGDVGTEDILDKVFSEFCVGK